MTIELLRLFGTHYAIFELDGDGDPVEFSSDAELSDHLRHLGLSEQQSDEAMEYVKTEPRRIKITVNRSARAL